ncbi:hypothetical protein OIU77_030381 [Salix suchowensis]|uniref:Photosystem II protein I n=1 Tax=Salix suchowensis TaxID=1278906 RepID=A0ABQ9BBQ7_9ROSI|nr:hypothetical protein OIU77_030381 [Salix suchowensis]
MKLLSYVCCTCIISRFIDFDIVVHLHQLYFDINYKYILILLLYFI